MVRRDERRRPRGDEDATSSSGWEAMRPLNASDRVEDVQVENALDAPLRRGVELARLALVASLGGFARGYDAVVAATAVAQARDEFSAGRWLDYTAPGVAALGALSSALSLLDVLCAFAVRVMTSGGPYVRPVFGDGESPLAIEAGRHPVLEELPGVDFVANSAYLSPAFNLSVVTGPNGGGKSTYLRQVAVLVVLAHSGCFVPARFFSAPPVDAVFTRVGTSDSMETDASTFAVECRECARILSRATSHSLVLVDELGRSTDGEEGERFAWATAEALLERGCKTLFATHARRLGKLAELYPNVRTSTMAVDLVGGRRGAADDPNRENGDDRNRRVECRYRLVDGACETPHYGLRAAEALGGFPAEMMRDAWAIARRVETAAAAATRRVTTGDDATRIAVERAARTAKVAERARRLFEIGAGGGEGSGGREKREAALASLRATAADAAGFAGGGACA